MGVSRNRMRLHQRGQDKQSGKHRFGRNKASRVFFFLKKENSPEQNGRCYDNKKVQHNAFPPTAMKTPSLCRLSPSIPFSLVGPSNSAMNLFFASAFSQRPRRSFAFPARPSSSPFFRKEPVLSKTLRLSMGARRRGVERLSDNCNLGISENFAQLAKTFLGHSRESGNPVFLGFSGLPLPRE
jgi:hypothetical protein